MYYVFFFIFPFTNDTSEKMVAKKEEGKMIPRLNLVVNYKEIARRPSLKEKRTNTIGRFLERIPEGKQGNVQSAKLMCVSNE